MVWTCDDDDWEAFRELSATELGELLLSKDLVATEHDKLLLIMDWVSSSEAHKSNLVSLLSTVYTGLMERQNLEGIVQSNFEIFTTDALKIMLLPIVQPAAYVHPALVPDNMVPGDPDAFVSIKIPIERTKFCFEFLQWKLQTDFFVKDSRLFLEIEFMQRSDGDDLRPLKTELEMFNFEVTTQMLSQNYEEQIRRKRYCPLDKDFKIFAIGPRVPSRKSQVDCSDVEAFKGRDLILVLSNVAK